MGSSNRQTRRVTLVAVLALLALTSAAAAEVRVTKHANGRVATETTLVNGQPHGLYREFFDTGRIRARIPHVNGQRHGDATWYYDNGKEHLKIPYVNGAVEGTELRFHRSGALHEEIPQRASRPHGVYKEYFDVEGDVSYGTRGVTRAAVPHVDGARDGLATWFYDNGRVQTQIPYTKGGIEGTELRFHRSGAVHEEVPQRGSRPHGLYKEYFDLKEPVAEGSRGGVRAAIPHVDGTRHGLATWYYDNGRVQSQIPYTKGGIEGTELRFHRSGALHEEVPQRESRPHGLYKEYFDIPDAQAQAGGDRAVRGPALPRAGMPKLRFVGLNGEVFDPEAPGAGEFRIEADIPFGAAVQDRNFTRGVLRAVIPNVKGTRAGRALWYYDNEKLQGEASYDTKGQCGVERNFDRDGTVLSTTQHRPCEAVPAAAAPAPANLPIAGAAVPPPDSRVASFSLSGAGRLIEIDDKGRMRALDSDGTIQLTRVSGTRYRSHRLRFEAVSPTTASAADGGRGR